MSNKEPGYVYILTNPSFREDWVKIGKSSRPVDVRSKEESKNYPFFFCTNLVQNSAPMSVATYQGIRIADKLPSVEALQERIKLLEAQLEKSAGQYWEREDV